MEIKLLLLLFHLGLARLPVMSVDIYSQEVDQSRSIDFLETHKEMIYCGFVKL